MKKRYGSGMIFLCALLVFAPACKKPAAFYGEAEEEVLEAGAEAEVRAEPEDRLCVYVCGCVREPGVYELLEGARIADALEAAGGMTEEAAVSALNLAQRVSDGQKIEVLSEEEEREQGELRALQESGTVNLNTASLDQLMTLAGIGESKAKAILDYREKKGGFSKIEELMDIPGIKEGVFEKIKDMITV